jgi:glucuronate isomerase
LKTFITENFLLETETARELYFNEAAHQPIYDYHCHLAPRQIAENYRFRNLYDIWLAGDHYKWRLMRANGIDERFCTGDADDREKYDAFVRTVPYTLRNPLYHWSHLELLRYFDIDNLINEESGGAIWDQANAQLAQPSFGVQGILEKNRVAVVVTTDDPTDSLEFHRQIRGQKLKTRVYPAFRPDGALKIGQPAVFQEWCAKLSMAADSDLTTFNDFLAALKKRHDFFHDQGCRLSDHGLESCLATECGEKQAARVFLRAHAGQPVTPEEVRQFGTFLMLYFGHLDAARGWTKQLHLGALRRVNSRMTQTAGPDTGFDSIGNFPQAEALGWFLDRLESNGDLPKMVLYSVNPADNYVLATMAGNFQDGSIPGKIQFGSGWWYLDQLEGMTWQLNALSNLGLLRRFVGMLTDSRSFLSYTRHEYFRRLLCNLLGNDVERGQLPRDMKLLGTLVREICFENAQGYFGLDLAPEYAVKTADAPLT